MQETIESLIQNCMEFSFNENLNQEKILFIKRKSDNQHFTFVKVAENKYRYKVYPAIHYEGSSTYNSTLKNLGNEFCFYIPLSQQLRDFLSKTVEEVRF